MSILCGQSLKKLPFGQIFAYFFDFRMFRFCGQSGQGVFLYKHIHNGIFQLPLAKGYMGKGSAQTVHAVQILIF